MHLIKQLLTCTLLMFVIFNFVSCKKDTTGSSEGCSPFSGITEVDHQGILGNIDTDDWKEAGIIISPMAYPNPTNGPYNIQFGLTEAAVIQITLNNHPDKVLKTLISDTLFPGMYRLHCDLVSDAGDTLPDCIHRIYFYATGNNPTYQTFGDIKIERY